MSETPGAVVTEAESDRGGIPAGPSSFEIDWERWRKQRFAAASAPHGPASLTLTYWFPDGEPHEVPGLGGEWIARGGRLVATGFAAGEYSHAGGGDALPPLVLETPRGAQGPAAIGEVLAGDRVVRRFERDGELALRIFDPAAEGRVGLQAIEVFGVEQRWRLSATFQPDVRARTIELADGHQTQTETSGFIVFTLDGVEHRLTGTRRSDGISVVFGDTTNGSESYGFRFLTIALPDPDGRTTIDFNRTFLPPCAFSDQFVCPLPTPENRLPVAIRAGERVVRR